MSSIKTRTILGRWEASTEKVEHKRTNNRQAALFIVIGACCVKLGSLTRPPHDFRLIEREVEDNTAIMFIIWKASLAQLLYFYEEKRPKMYWFFPMLFVFFVVLNIACYWLAMYTAYPEYMKSQEANQYILLQYPVGFLGAVFDSLSFFVTIWIIRRALECTKLTEYVGHLSLDAVIAIIATFWVLFVFTWGGQIVSMVEAINTEAVPESFSDRTGKTTLRVQEAIENPLGNWRNIYFGLLMGISASLPTFAHISLFFYSSMIAVVKKLRPKVEREEALAESSE